MRYKILDLVRSFVLAPVAGLALVACGAEAPMDQGLNAMGGSAAENETQGPLSVELLPSTEGTGMVEYRLTNTGEAPLRFLPSDTAVDGAVNNLFDVRHEGEPVPYVGPRISFDEPREEYFVELQPGASLSATIDLTDLYDMDKPGLYSVRARSRRPMLFPVDLAERQGQLLLDASAVAISVDERHLHQPIELASELVDKALQQACVSSCEQVCSGGGDPIRTGQCFDACPFNCNPRGSCSVAEDDSLNTATAEARRLLPIAIDAIDAGPEYLTWFGIRLDRRTNEVGRVLTGIRGDLDVNRQRCLNAGDLAVPGSSGGFGCAGGGVTQPIVAATNGALGQNVVYCPVFFERNLRQRASTVVHEASHHFGAEDIRDLSDLVINNDAAAQALAIADSEAAIVSAVNYQRYVTDPRF